MEHRKDKKNRVLKDGESYREKENRYMYRWLDNDKKRHYIYAATLSELRRKEKEISQNVNDGINTEKSNMRLDDLYDWWKNNKIGIKESTYVNYVYMYERFIGPRIGHMKLKDIRRSTVRGLYNNLTKCDDAGQVMAINTLEIIHNVLHQILQVAVDDDYIRKNPTDRALKEIKKANSYERPQRKALTVEQQKIFVDFLKTKPYYKRWSILFAVLLGTGCRISEFVGLRWCDVDWEHNLISINHNLVYRVHENNKCYFTISTPKTNAGCRTIPMLPEVRKALEDERCRQQKTGKTCQTVVDGYKGFIFFNRYGNAYQPAAINRQIDRVVLAYNEEETKAAEKEMRMPVLLPDFSCHQLRHTFCTRMCENETNIKVVQDIMGHTDIRTTLEIYAEAQDALKEKAVENLAGKIGVY